MAKHTPGEWFIEPNSLAVRADEGRIYICTGYRNMTEGEGEANTRLIAAAPLMYDALKDLLSASQVLQNILKKLYKDQKGLNDAEHARTRDAQIKAQLAITKAVEGAPTP